MTTSRTGAIVRRLRAGGPTPPTGQTDGELLERFVRHRDEAAIEVLVRRHAPMVWGVCRRILRNHHDAEDALQATFIVLVRRAASVVPRHAVANWLYGVARQTALKARQMAAKRKVRERQVAERPEPAAPEADLWRGLEPLLDRELSSLPEKYRVLIVLCDLEARTRREAAELLGVPEGTVAGRLARARALLAARLTRRGLPVTTALLPGVLATGATAGASGAPVPAAVRIAVTTARSAATGPAVDLAEGVMKAMFVTKLKVSAAVLLALAAVGAAVALVAPPSWAAQKQRVGGPGLPDLRPVGEPEKAADLSGRWQGEEWARVELKAVKPGTYEGTYTDTFGPGPGTISLTWEAFDRRFNGTWAEGKDRFGTISVRLDGGEIRGAFTTDPNCKIRPGKPALADLRWVRSPEQPAAPGGVGAGAAGGEMVVWGKPSGNLRMGIARSGPKRVSVVIENTGDADTVVNLGIMLANGKTQLPTAIRLLITDAAGKTVTHRWPEPRIAGRVDPFVVPLPAGARYTVALPLDKYIGADKPLADGRYRIAAEFTGRGVLTDRDMGGLALMKYWTGTVTSGEVRLDVPAGVAKSGPSELDGVWTSVSLESRGQERGVQSRGGVPARWVIARGEITESERLWMVGEPAIEEWTFRVDPAKSPKEIDLVPGSGPLQGTPLKGIYKIEKGTLTICYISPSAEDPEKQPRPTDFETRRKENVVVRRFEQEKP